jgi:hypothetical protein
MLDAAVERSPAECGGYDMTVERTHLAHETRYVLGDGTDRRCVIAWARPETVARLRRPADPLAATRTFIYLERRHRLGVCT